MIYNDVPCKLWFKHCDDDGYGVRWYKDKLWKAHRAAWDEEVGPIPDGMYVLHHCDNPPCREVKHLFLGTQQDNMDDMKKKGRFPIGQNNVRSKLTDLDVEEIREKWATKKYYQFQLANEYGVNPNQISRIVNFKSRIGASS